MTAILRVCTVTCQWERAGAVARLRAEQARAGRVAAQLRALLAELRALRRRVRAADRPRFDALTQRSRDLTLAAIRDYLGNFLHVYVTHLPVHT